ncbi:MAG: UxaA family hydrolase [Anaerolineaceae bacterium]|nr:UxaA family hydrolase [Anaerolineaceae bacterium]
MNAKNNVLVINAMDSVAVLLEPLRSGDTAVATIAGQDRQIPVLQDIPIYHKIAVCDIAKDQEIFKYGKSIGRATSNIHSGEYVHNHNIVSNREAIVQERWH